jgi:hypothetical protein
MPVSVSDAPRGTSWSKPVRWGVAFGLVHAFAPFGLWWLAPTLVWSLALVLIASVYIGLAVADGRPRVLVAEVLVTAAFVVFAAIAVVASPWLAVVGLVAHGLKDLWQHRTQFVADTRWWPPFCLVVDFVAAAVIAVLLLAGVRFPG